MRALGQARQNASEDALSNLESMGIPEQQAALRVVNCRGEVVIEDVSQYDLSRPKPVARPQVRNSRHGLGRPVIFDVQRKHAASLRSAQAIGRFEEAAG